MHRAIFMDRDGTVSEEVGYMYHAGLYKPFPWTGQAIRRINESGMKAVLVTNQSGIGRGYFSAATVAEVHDVLNTELTRWNAHLDAIYYCPHSPDANCECRKPNTGMLLQAQREMGIDLKRSFVIGDRYLDIRMAHAAGAHAILVRSGDGENELRHRSMEDVQPELVSENLLTAVNAILNGDVG
jgi:D-glycero-D-manno-heptose 1,7-bisphosphate phosphatase